MSSSYLPAYLSPQVVGESLRRLHDELAGHSWVARQQLVLGTRIPVLKIRSVSGVPVDITISDSPQVHPYPCPNPSPKPNPSPNNSPNPNHIHFQRKES